MKALAAFVLLFPFTLHATEPVPPTGAPERRAPDVYAYDVAVVDQDGVREVLVGVVSVKVLTTDDSPAQATAAETAPGPRASVAGGSPRYAARGSREALAH